MVEHLIFAMLSATTIKMIWLILITIMQNKGTLLRHTDSVLNTYKNARMFDLCVYVWSTISGALIKLLSFQRMRRLPTNKAICVWVPWTKSKIPIVYQPYFVIVQHILGTLVMAKFGNVVSQSGNCDKTVTVTKYCGYNWLGIKRYVFEYRVITTLQEYSV